jgi:Spy/CpxP family protein refolding chaperone
MSRISRFFNRRTLVGGALVLTAVLGLSGCWHSRWHGRYDPARLDERLSDIQEDVASDLKITPAQKPAFDALMAEYKQAAHGWRDGWHQTGLEVKTALEQQPADATAVGAALKRQVHQRMDEATLDKLIDDTVAFYNTLEPEQQQQVRDRMLRHLQRRLG